MIKPLFGLLALATRLGSQIGHHQPDAESGENRNNKIKKAILDQPRAV
jgi:hypothetical protein